MKEKGPGVAWRAPRATPPTFSQAGQFYSATQRARLAFRRRVQRLLGRFVPTATRLQSARLRQKRTDPSELDPCARALQVPGACEKAAHRDDFQERPLLPSGS